MQAGLALLGDGRTAVVETAAASGLALLRPSERDPKATTSYGTGELIRAALDAGAETIIVGLGGRGPTRPGRRPTGSAAAPPTTRAAVSCRRWGCGCLTMTGVTCGRAGRRSPKWSALT